LEAYTDDPNYSAGSYLRDEDRAGTFIQAALPAGGNLVPQHVGRLTPAGRKIDPAWLQAALSEERKRTMVLVECNTETTKPLVLVVKKQNGGEVIAKIKFPLSITRVKTMYRWVNLRHYIGESESDPTSVSEPLNWPDKLSSLRIRYLRLCTAIASVKSRLAIGTRKCSSECTGLGRKQSSWA
jgi:hypothetical protein